MCGGNRKEVTAQFQFLWTIKSETLFCSFIKFLKNYGRFCLHLQYSYYVLPKFILLLLFNIQVKVGESGLERSKFHLLRRQLPCTPKIYDYYFIFSRFFSLLHLKNQNVGETDYIICFIKLWNGFCNPFQKKNDFFWNRLQNPFHNFMKRIL